MNHDKLEMWSGASTPFKIFFSIDPASVCRLRTHRLRLGVTGIMLGGTCGESPWMTLDDLAELPTASSSDAVFLKSFPILSRSPLAHPSARTSRFRPMPDSRRSLPSRNRRLPATSEISTSPWRFFPVIRSRNERPSNSHRQQQLMTTE